MAHARGAHTLKLAKAPARRKKNKMSSTKTKLSQAELSELKSLARDYAVATADDASHVRFNAISRLLRRMREILRMDVVFVSEFVEGRRVFRHADAAEGAPDIVKVGHGDPVEQSYCFHVVRGRLARAIPDAQLVPEALELAATRAVPIGAHLSVPIVLRDGHVYGTLCCFSCQPDPSLGEADAQALEAVANLIASGIDRKGELRDLLLVRDVQTAAPRE
jgi:GAF domain-containing protein